MPKTKTKTKTKTKIKTIGNAQTRTTTYTDERDRFKRTALVIKDEYETGPDNGSVDVVVRKPDGRYVRLAQVNFFVTEGGRVLMADIIDVDNLYNEKRALVFPADGGRKEMKADTLVAAHFERKG